MSAKNLAAGMRIEVLLNGRRVAVAGFEEFGVVSAIVTWLKRFPPKVPERVRAAPEFDEREFLREECIFELSGLDSVTDRDFRWARDALAPGSEITIRVLGPGEFDEPESL